MFATLVLLAFTAAAAAGADADTTIAPTIIAAAIGALVTAVPVIVTLVGLVLPFVRRWLDEHVAAKDVELLKAAVKGAYLVVSKFSVHTQTTLDDQLAELLRIADKEFEQSRGRPMTPEEQTHALHIAVTMHADPKHPDLKTGDPLAALRSLTSKIAAAGNGASA